PIPLGAGDERGARAHEEDAARRPRPERRPEGGQPQLALDLGPRRPRAGSGPEGERPGGRQRQGGEGERGGDAGSGRARDPRSQESEPELEAAADRQTGGEDRAHDEAVDQAVSQGKGAWKRQ